MARGGSASLTCCGPIAALARCARPKTLQHVDFLLEQDHRGIKQRYYPMRGFGSFEAAARFCTAHDELRDYFRSRKATGETVPLVEQRQLFRARWDALMRLKAS